MKILKGLLIVFSFILVSCSSSNKNHTKTFMVNSFKVPCTGVAPMSCLQVKEQGVDVNWSNFYSTIEGFTFEPGFLYTIEVVVETIPKDLIPADGSSLKYTLVKLISKEQDTRFAVNDIWVLDKLEVQSASDVFDRLPVLEININAKSYLGNDGCNNYSGTLETLNDSQIGFGLAISTKMACPNDSWSFKYMELLMKSNTYKVEKGKLFVFQDEEVLLVFKKTD
ncbi:DUF4377 domain-containing protein [Cognatitamlana onchidii]|uniref:DUF4377 domain-containing protein n=1 Tax=Cognatitamlana onchidii TaxID=2562860 RepID=UPI0010A6721F|nr:DUF4377 domain-containing protein [Algibacter onchidii]